MDRLDITDPRDIKCILRSAEVVLKKIRRIVENKA